MDITANNSNNCLSNKSNKSGGGEVPGQPLLCQLQADCEGQVQSCSTSSPCLKRSHYCNSHWFKGIVGTSTMPGSAVVRAPWQVDK